MRELKHPWPLAAIVFQNKRLFKVTGNYVHYKVVIYKKRCKLHVVTTVREFLVFIVQLVNKQTAEKNIRRPRRRILKFDQLPQR